jgi:hypothetical protein
MPVNPSYWGGRDLEVWGQPGQKDTVSKNSWEWCMPVIPAVGKYRQEDCRPRPAQPKAWDSIWKTKKKEGLGHRDMAQVVEHLASLGGTWVQIQAPPNKPTNEQTYKQTKITFNGDSAKAVWGEWFPTTCVGEALGIFLWAGVFLRYVGNCWGVAIYSEPSDQLSITFLAF